MHKWKNKIMALTLTSIVGISSMTVYASEESNKIEINQENTDNQISKEGLIFQKAILKYKKGKAIVLIMNQKWSM